VPNVIKGSNEEKEAINIFENQTDVIKAKKSVFTQNNVVLNINKSEEDLLAEMHSKHRYNIRYAEKKGVKVYRGKTNEDFEIFYKLLEETGKRQNFLNHPKDYYKKILELMQPKGIAHLLIAKYNEEALASWFVFTYKNVLYYPYGGSTNKHRNIQASNLLGWEAIKLGKKNGCTLFDMWGACKDLNDTNDPEWGFTNFKMKFGGEFVEYMDSYELVLNKKVYQLFELAYPKVIKLLKKLR
jgi:lipid II:glycine glycyltransferase (peptidoglycan interpeptide bridge formation enzyme)